MLINLMGAPSSGKSTTRAGLFYKLKCLGFSVEEVPEFAKDLVYEKRQFTLTCQPYVFAKQLRNIERLQNQVDIIVTDSPLILSRYYGMKYTADKYPKSFYDFVAEQFKSMKSLNFYIERKFDYVTEGRNQSEEEAIEVDIGLKAMLNELDIPFKIVPGDATAIDMISVDIFKCMEDK